MTTNWRWIFILLILPIIFLVGLGWIFHLSNFYYINEFVIASGPIYSACVVLYVAISRDTNESERIDEQRTATTEYLSSLITEAIESISSEIDHYDELANDLHQRSFEEKSLKSTSFHYCEKIEDLFSDDLYRSIIHRVEVANKQPLSDRFIELLNAVNNVIFLKENVKNQFENYIRMHNKYAQLFVDAQLGYSELDTEIRANPSGNTTFDTRFISIINTYNQGIINGSINQNLINSYRQNLVTPLNQLANQFVTFNHDYLKDLVKYNHKAKMSLDKMDSFQQQLETHLQVVHSDLNEAKDILRNCNRVISGTL